MRFVWLLAGTLLLTSCGQSSTESTPTAEAPAQPRTYAVSDFIRLNGATVATTAEGVQIVTDPRTGAMSASLDLGEEALRPGMMLRVRGRVSDGAFSLVSTHANWEPGYQPYSQGMLAGDEVTVNLPIDRGGVPLLVIGNGRPTEGSSTGVIKSVELVRAEN